MGVGRFTAASRSANRRKFCGSPDDALTATISWGDGSVTPGVVSFAAGAGTATGTHVYADNGTYAVTVTVTDRAGLIGSRATTVTAANAAPTLAAAAAQFGGVNRPLALVLGSFADPGFTSAAAGTSETFAATVTWGDGTPDESATVTVTQGSAGTPTTGSVNATHAFTQPGVKAVTVRVTDDDAGAGVGTLAVTVVAHPAAVTSVSMPASKEGQAVVYSASFTDADPGDAHAASVNWGDGTSSAGTVTYAGGVGSVAATHTYADDRPAGYAAVLTLTDKYGLTATKSVAAAVSNVAPTAAAGANASGQAGTALSVPLGTFTDPGFTFAQAGTAETFAATVTWGDGTPAEAATVTVTPGSAGTPSAGTAKGTHAYAAAGTYAVTTRVADDDGGTSTVTQTVTVAAAPAAGLGCWAMAAPAVTGVSRATSVTAAGATTSDASLVVVGTGQPGATLTLKRGGAALGTTVVLADSTWRYDDTATSLAAGSYAYTAEQLPLGPFGPAGGFNAFVQNNVSGIPDAEGRLAAGGDVTLSNFSVAQKVAGSNYGRDHLVAGGKLTLTGGQVFGGNAAYGTTAAVSANTTLAQGSVRKESVYDFAAAFTDLRAKADAWAGIAATGPATYAPTGSRWAVGVSGNDAAFNAFTVDGSKLSQASSFAISAPATATVLVNVTGTSGSMQNFAFTLSGGVTRQRVVFNFAQYTALTLTSIGVAGSVFAPRADVNFVQGNLDGTLVAKGLTGGDELHDYQFLSSCPTLTSPAFTVAVQNPTATAAPKFFVVGGTQTTRLAAAGTLLGTNPLAAGGAVTGVAANATGTATWAVAANADGTTAVTQYDADGSVRSSWRAYGVTDARDLATNGTDLWVVGKAAATGTFKVFRYAKAAFVRSGGLEPASSFALNASNANPTGLATDGSTLFVTDKSAAGGRVFAYDINGVLLGNAQNNPWRLDPANADPSGVTLSPSGGNELWVVDKTTKRVYSYAAGRGAHWYNSGQPQAASGSFALPAGSPAPEGIADPDPTPLSLGQLASGALTDPGQADVYALTLAAGQKVYFDRIDGYLATWTVTAPSGQVAFSDFGSDRHFTASEAGTYSVALTDPYGYSPAYSFRVVSVADPAPVAIAPDAPVTGSVADPGETRRYAFAASAGTLLYFDRTARPGEPTYARLVAPSGGVVFEYASDDLDTFALPESGTYALEFFQPDGLPGDFAFEMVTVLPPTVTPIALGLTVSGSIAAPREQDSFTFAATPGQVVAFTPAAGDPNLLHWRLVGPDGEAVFDSPFDSTASRLIRSAGTHTLTLSGLGDFTGGYAFAVQPATPAAVALAPTEAVSGEIAAAGEYDFYSLTLPNSAGLYFEAAPADPSLRWDLFGPAGFVRGGELRSYQSDLREGQPSGDYTLVVSHPGGGLSPYGFRVSDAIRVTITPIVLGEVTSGDSGRPGGLTYSFVGATRQLVSFETLNAASGAYATLTTPTGLLLASWSTWEDRGTLVLPETGTYLLHLRFEVYVPGGEGGGEGGGLGSLGGGERGEAFEFRLSDVVPQPAVPVAFDTPVFGVLAEGGETDVYTFPAATGDLLRFLPDPAWYNTNSVIRWTLVGPDDSFLLRDAAVQLVTLRAHAAGLYTLYVAHISGSYAETRFRVAAVTPSVTQVTLGQLVTATMPAGTLAAQEYAVTVPAGQIVFAHPILGATTEHLAPLEWSLTAADGAVVFSTVFGLSDVYALAGGVYTLRVENRPVSNGAVDYSFRFSTVPATIDTPIALDVPTVATTVAPGQVLRYTFEAVAGQRVSVLPDYNLTLRGPDGLAFETYYERRPVTLTQTGTYTLTYDPSGDAVGSAQVAVWLVEEPVPSPLVFDAWNRVRLTKPFEAFALSFPGNSGELLYIDPAEGFGQDTIPYRLLRPDGSALAALPGRPHTYRLDDAGSWTVRVGDLPYIAGQYRFMPVRAAADEARHGLINTPYAGRLATQDQTVSVSYTLTAGTRLAFDNTLPPGDTAFTLRGPDGRPVPVGPEGRSLFADVSTDLMPFTVATAGVYTLTAVGVPNDLPAPTGPFRVQLQEVPTPTAGPPDQSGTEFWLAFPDASYEHDLTVFVSGDIGTTGALMIPGIGFVSAFTVVAGQVTAVDLPSGAQLTRYLTLENRGVHVVTLDPVTVYALQYAFAASEAYRALPVSALGTEYVALAHEGTTFQSFYYSSQFSVVSTRDGTTVTVAPSPSPNGDPNTPITLTLDAGQVYTQLGTDVTGSVVTADHPVAVFSGHNFTYLPVDKGYANPLLEQLPPVAAWGHRYLTAPFGGRTAPTLYRVVAAADGTEVRIDGVVAGVLNRGQYLERLLTRAAEFVGSGPILVGQFSLGGTAETPAVGDPSFAVVPAVEQYRDRYTVQAIDRPIFTSHYLNVTIPTAAAGTLTIDGVAVGASPFTPIPGTDHSSAQILTTAGTHAVAAAAAFGVVVYGYGFYDMYSYTGASGLAPVGRVASLDLAPESAAGVTGVPTPLSATARDAAGGPVGGVRVDFAVTGANPRRGFAHTDATGVARFAYAGTAVGLDTVVATLAGFAATAAVSWASPTAAPTVRIDDPAPGASVAAGRPIVLVGQAAAGTALGRVTLVTVNGVPVESLDATGRFFAVVTPAAGTNTYTVVARDTAGQTAAATVTVIGLASDPAVGGFRRTRLPMRLTYAGTTFHRPSGRLLVDATLVNDGLVPIPGPVAAEFRGFDPADVTLHGVPPSDSGRPAVRFDGVAPAGGPGATRRLSFEVPGRERFDFGVDFLAPGNAAPAFSSAPRLEAAAGRAFADAAAAADPNGDPVSFRLASGPAGMAINIATGAIAWTPPAGLVGPVQVELEASDGRGGSARQQYQVEVRDPAANRPPVFRTVPATKIYNYGTFVYAPTAFDPDADPVSYAGSSAPAGWSVDPATGAVASPDRLPPGAYAVTLVADDGRGGRAVQSFVVGTQFVADSAVSFASQAPARGAVGQQFAYLPTVASSTARPLTYILLNPPANATFDTATGFLTWTPDASQAGPRAFVLTASDALGSATQAFTVEVAAARQNRAPLVTSRAPALATRGVALDYAVAAADPDGDAVSFGVTPDTAALGVTIDPATGRLAWTPAAGQSGTYALTVVATDAPGGAAGRQTFAVEVRAPNSAPSIAADPGPSATAGSVYAARFRAADAEGDAVRFALAPGAALGMAIDPISGQFYWDTRAGPAPAGPRTVRVVATDERGLSATYDLTVAVLPDTRKPTAAIFVPASTRPGTPTAVGVSSEDDVGVVALTLTADGVPVPLDYFGDGTFTPTGPGVVRLVLTATDAAGNSVTVSRGLRVTDPADADAPTVAVTSPQPDAEVTYLTQIRGTVADANLDGFRVEVSRYDANEWATIATGSAGVTDGVLATFDPTLLENGAYTVRVVAADVNGRETAVTFEVGVSGQAKLGDFRQEFADLVVPLAGIPIAITRVYDTLKAGQSGDFGFGWSLGAGYDPRVRETRPVNPGETLLGMFAAAPFKDGTRVYATTPDGRRVGFTFEPKAYTGDLAGLGGAFGGFFGAYYRPDPGVFETLEGEYDGGFDAGFPLPLIKVDGGYYLPAISVPYNPVGYNLTTKEGLKYHFGQFDGLKSITDRNGVTLSFTAAGITSSTGPSIAFTRDNQGRITQVTDPNGKAITYTYDARGDLVGVVDQVGTKSQYAYSAARPHYLADINNATGGCGCFASAPPMRMEYDADGRLAATANELGESSRFTYDPAGFTERVTDPRGGVTAIAYDARGNVVRVTDPLGHGTGFTYDAADNELTRTDANGHVTAKTYDARGNVLSASNGRGETSTAKFNAFNSVASIVDAEGRNFAYDYDARGNLIRVTAPRSTTPGAGLRLAAAPSQVTEFTYNSAGTLASVVDARGMTTQFEYAFGLALPVGVTGPDGSETGAVYDASGRLLQTQDENGFVTQYRWDDAGRLGKLIDAAGGFVSFAYRGSRVTSTTDSLNRTNAIEYDSAFRKTKVTDADGKAMRYEYDPDGDLTRKIDANGHATVYEYRSDRRLSKTTTADGAVSTYDYDPAGNVVSHTDARGNVTKYAYDAADRVAAMTAADGGGTSYGYDAVGNMISVVDPLAHRTDYGYDAYNRVVSILNAEGGSSTYRYDEVGNLTRKTDSNGHATEYRYDQRSHLASAADGLGRTTSYDYNPAGYLSTFTDANGHATRYGYDGCNRLLTATDALGGTMAYRYDSEGQLTQSTDERGLSTLRGYDSVGRLTRLTDAEGGVAAMAYDPVGNRTATTDANGHATTFAYDAVDRLTRATDARGGATAYGYDPNGNVASMTDANGHATAYRFDAMDRLTRTTDALGGHRDYGYDLGGNLLSGTDRNGHATAYAYDKLDRMTTRTDAAGGVSGVGYDAVGNRTSSRDELGRTTAYAYDAADQLVSVVDPLGGTASFRFDGVGNRVGFTDQLGRASSYGYDGLDRMTRQTDAGGFATALGYDPAGNLVSVVDPLGRATAMAYDKLGRETSVTAADGGVSRVAYDKVGNAVATTDPLGRVTAFAYDELNRGTAQTDPRGSVVRMSYDAVGMRLSLTDPNGNATTFGYDPLNRTATDTDARGKTRTYEYDAEGNVTAAFDRNGRRREFTYDVLDRRTAEVWKSAAGATVSAAAYAYDAVGNTTAAGDANSTYALRHDALDRLTQIDNRGTPASPRLVLDYGYDAVGHRTSVADNFGVSVASAYDARDLLTARTWSGGGVAAAKVVMEYDGAAQRVALGRFRDVAGTQVVARAAEGYDAAGRLAGRATTKADGSGVVEYRYAYNLAGEVTQEASHGVATDYSYDLAGQVVAAARPASPGEAYAYDAAGNAAGAGRAVGPANRVASDAAFDYGYDDEGNLTSRVERATGEVTAFAYDHRDRLTGSERRSAGGVLLASSQYTYDVFDRLIVRTVGGVAAATVYDGVNPWADAAGGGAVTARYLYGDGADEVLARWTPAGGQAWYLPDKQGTVRDLIDAAGAVVGTRSYDAFGRILAESGVVDRFAFQGREWDAGVGLYQFRARWYDPVTRQFTSADPLGFAAGDANTRRFVGNNPLTGTDPSGTSAVEYLKLALEGAKQGAKVGAILGGICGFLNGLAAPAANSFDRMRNAALGGFAGALEGAAAGGGPGGIRCVVPGGQHPSLRRREHQRGVGGRHRG